MITRKLWLPFYILIAIKLGAIRVQADNDPGVGSGGTDDTAAGATSFRVSAPLHSSTPNALGAISDGDVDWYEFSTMGTSDRIDLYLIFLDVGGDGHHLRIYKKESAGEDELVHAAVTTGQSAVFSIMNPEPRTTHRIQVEGGVAAGAVFYALTVIEWGGAVDYWAWSNHYYDYFSREGRSYLAAAYYYYYRAVSKFLFYGNNNTGVEDYYRGLALWCYYYHLAIGQPERGATLYSYYIGIAEHFETPETSVVVGGGGTVAAVVSAYFGTYEFHFN